MEHLGFFIYICSILNGVLIIEGIVAFIAFIIATANYGLYYEEGDKTYIKRANKFAFICICSVLAFIITPSKKTCYEIFGVTKAIEIHQKAEELRQLPKKSLEVLNKTLDSIISVETNTMEE